MELSDETFIDAAPDTVFAALIDLERWPQRIPAIARIEVIGNEPIGIGTQFRETRMMDGKPQTMIMIISEMAAAERLVLTAHEHGNDLTATHHLRAQAEGTLLLTTMVLRPRTVLARLLQPLSFIIAPLARKQLRDDLAALKASIERETGAADGKVNRQARPPQ